MKLITFLILFLFFSAFFIISNENLQLHKKNDALEFGKQYYSWLGNMLGNVKSVTAFVIKSEWMPNK